MGAAVRTGVPVASRVVLPRMINDRAQSTLPALRWCRLTE
jgi:hypothetical protein